MSLRDRLRAGSFAVTAEISPPRGASTDPITATAALLRDWVDAVNVTDNQGSNVRLASWAGSLAALQAGLEPVMQMTCRDRNRIALQSDLLGASALGIRNVLVMTGDHPKFGDHPEAKPVFDLDSVQLLWTLRHMRDQGAVLSGRALKPPPDCFLGAVENPSAPPAEFRAERLGKKIAAGAQFVQTQFVFDVGSFAQWMAQVRDLGLHEQCYILAGVGAVRSRGALDYMRDKVPGVYVPDDVYRRLRAVPADQTAAEGARLAAETIQQLSAIEGVAGVHLLVAGNEQAVPGILDSAGICAGPDHGGGLRLARRPGPAARGLRLDPVQAELPRGRGQQAGRGSGGHRGHRGGDRLRPAPLRGHCPGEPHRARQAGAGGRIRVPARAAPGAEGARPGQLHLAVQPALLAGADALGGGHRPGVRAVSARRRERRAEHRGRP